MTNEITKKRRDAIRAAGGWDRARRGAIHFIQHAREEIRRLGVKAEPVAVHNIGVYLDAATDALDAAEAKMGEPVAWMVEGLLRDGTKVLRLPVLTSREDAELYSIRNPDEVLVALYAAPPAAEPVKPTHRHKKRGTEYVLIGYGKMQAENWCSVRLATMEPMHRVDMREVAIYRSVDDGTLWVRPREEFEDGRFEPLAAAPALVSEKEAE